MAVSDIAVVNAALSLLGEPPIASFSDGSEASTHAGQHYERVILNLLGRHQWHFAQVHKVLEVDAAAPATRNWTYGYFLPPLLTDRVGKPIGFFASTSTRAPYVFDFEIEGRWVFTDYTVMVCEYVQRVHENLWPGYFEELAVEALAGTLAMPISESRSAREDHMTAAFGTPSDGGVGGLFRTAMQADSQGGPTRSLLDASDPVSEARFGDSYGSSIR